MTQETPLTPEQIKRAKIFVFAMTVFVCLLISYIVFNVITAAYGMQEINTTYSEQSTRAPIRSLSDASLMSGNFFLGSGQISDKTYFVYYEGENSYRLKKVPTDYTMIINDEEDHPYILYKTMMITVCRRNGTCRTGTETYGIDLQGWEKSYKTNWNAMQYEIHVPKNTFVRDSYKLDGV